MFTGYSLASYSVICWWHVCRVDPDRDGLLFKQHEYGIAKQRLSRLKAYEKYLTLTTREKKLLEFDQKENLEQIEKQVGFRPELCILITIIIILMIVIVIIIIIIIRANTGTTEHV
jgi:hypothetical protein